MDDARAGRLLVVAQTACEAALLLPGRRLWADRPALRAAAWVLGGAGGAVAAAAAGALGRRLRAHPEPPSGAVLRTQGVYARVRHPLYVGLLVAAAGVVVARARAASCVAAAALAVVLRAKAAREDDALARRFGPAHDRYRAVTPGWLPGHRAVTGPRGGRR